MAEPREPPEPLSATIFFAPAPSAGGAPRPDPAAHFLVPVARPGDAIRVGPTPIELGRAPSNHLRLDEPSVSSRHARVVLGGGDVWIEDLGSTNGTFVDGQRVTARARVPVGSLLELGRAQLRHELRDERAVAEEAKLTGELDAAAKYITELLPEPWSGRPIDVAWRFVPSRRLGGDSLGYFELDRDRTAMYLIDVCGHGPRAALHSVTILNTLRLRTLPIDYSDPGAVVTALNRAFPMEAHAGMFFTIWYGVFDLARRRLSYAAGGHPPALLAGGEPRSLARLPMKRPPIGSFDGLTFTSEHADLPPRSWLYLFSDGVTEEEGADQKPLGLPWLERVILDRSPATPDGEAARIETALRGACPSPRFHDDITLVVARLSS